MWNSEKSYLIVGPLTTASHRRVLEKKIQLNLENVPLQTRTVERPHISASQERCGKDKGQNELVSRVCTQSQVHHHYSYFITGMRRDCLSVEQASDGPVVHPLNNKPHRQAESKTTSV